MIPIFTHVLLYCTVLYLYFIFHIQSQIGLRLNVNHVLGFPKVVIHLTDGLDGQYAQMKARVENMRLSGETKLLLSIPRARSITTRVVALKMSRHEQMLLWVKNNWNLFSFLTPILLCITQMVRKL